MCGSDIALQVTESHSSPVSPPPYMAGAIEIELDPETGHVEILDYYAVVDCGTVINPNLARVQAEGGIVQGIGMTLYENIQYTEKGQFLNNSFMQYKIPTGWIWEICMWNLRAAMSRPDRLAQNRLVKSSSIHRLRH